MGRCRAESAPFSTGPGAGRRCRYGARRALALEWLSRAEDGRIVYRMIAHCRTGHHAPALHRVRVTASPVVTGVCAWGKPHEVPRRLRSRLRTAAIFGPSSRCARGLSPRPGWSGHRDQSSDREKFSTSVGGVPYGFSECPVGARYRMGLKCDACAPARLDSNPVLHRGVLLAGIPSLCVPSTAGSGLCALWLCMSGLCLGALVLHVTT